MCKTFNRLLAFGYLIVIVSCNNTSLPDKNRLTAAKWLLGEWQNITPNGTYTETWIQETDSAFTGESYYIIEKDTPSSEKTRLEQHGQDLFYIPTVEGQNNNEPVPFKLTFLSQEQLVFENPKHDFPQKITYTRINSDSLVASISGTKAGKADSMLFPLKRVN
jgi:hypothetical protein